MYDSRGDPFPGRSLSLAEVRVAIEANADDPVLFRESDRLLDSFGPRALSAVWALSSDAWPRFANPEKAPFALAQGLRLGDQSIRDRIAASGLLNGIYRRGRLDLDLQIFLEQEASDERGAAFALARLALLEDPSVVNPLEVMSYVHEAFATSHEGTQFFTSSRKDSSLLTTEASRLGDQFGVAAYLAVRLLVAESEDLLSGVNAPLLAELLGSPDQQLGVRIALGEIVRLLRTEYRFSLTPDEIVEVESSLARLLESPDSEIALAACVGLWVPERPLAMRLSNLLFSPNIPAFSRLLGAVLIHSASDPLIREHTKSILYSTPVRDRSTIELGMDLAAELKGPHELPDQLMHRGLLDPR